jgi:hypothetical protein
LDPNESPSGLADDAAFENLRLALASGADPAMLLTVLLASLAPPTIEEAFASLEARKSAVLEIVRAGAGDQERRPARLEPDLVPERELGRMRPDIGDHEIRGKLLFAELLGKRSFFEIAAFAIAGLDVGKDNGEFLDHSGVLTQLLDPQIWGLAVARRIGARTSSLAHALIAGLACICTNRMTGQPVGGFMRFLDHAEEQASRGVGLAETLDALRARGERIPGIGRPVVGPDERVPEIKRLAERYGLTTGKSWRLALEIDGYFAERTSVRINSAGLQGALLRDLGFSPAAASAFCMIYFIVPVLANAVFLSPAR